jgi:hypothetical protein
MEVKQVSVGDDLLAELHELVVGFDPGTTHFKVDMFDGLRADIFFDEHPPPHFAVSYDGERANFAIVDGKRLRKNKGLELHERNIRKWWEKNRFKLIKLWNASRPSDCPVGPIEYEIGSPPAT